MVFSVNWTQNQLIIGYAFFNNNQKLEFFSVLKNDKFVELQNQDGQKWPSRPQGFILSLLFIFIFYVVLYRNFENMIS